MSAPQRTERQRSALALVVSKPTRKRRGRGEGALYQRASDGLWVGVFQSGSTRTVVYAKTKEQALAKLDKERGLFRSDESRAHAKLTVEKYLERWLEDGVKDSVRPATHALYARTVRLHITPGLGIFRVQRLTPAHVQQLLGDMARRGASARLRQIALQVLHRALKQAVRWEVILRNPCDAVARPKAPRHEIVSLDRKQITAFLKVAKKERLFALYVVAIASGMRISELLGLRWADFDERQGAVHVRRQLVRVPNARSAETRSFELAEPKTAAGRRRIDLPKSVVTIVVAHRVRMTSEKHAQPDSPMFCAAHGGPLQHNNLVNRSFKPLLERAGLPPIRFHDLRHTSATMLLGLGVHPKVVSERLGHAQVGLTLDLYSHVLPSMQKVAAAKLNSIFRKCAPVGAVRRPSVHEKSLEDRRLKMCR